jgi:Zn-dependent peptidase ImmA (M78 family)
MEANYSYARDMARKVIRDNDLTEVPTDLVKIFSRLELEYVQLTDPNDDDGAIIWIEEKPKIAVLNIARPLQRQRFTLAHELGHIFLNHQHRDSYNPEEIREQGETGKSTKPEIEKEPDAFAAELLVPYEQLKKYSQDMNNIEKLANTFKVSKQVMTLAVMHYWKYVTRKKK